MNSVGIQLLGEGSDSLVLRGLVSASLQTTHPNESTTLIVNPGSWIVVQFNY